MLTWLCFIPSVIVETRTRLCFVRAAAYFLSSHINIRRKQLAFCCELVLHEDDASVTSFALELP